MFQCMFIAYLLTVATEAPYFQSPRFLLRQRPKFSSFEVQVRRGYRYCGNRGFHQVVPEKSARDGAKVATPSGPSRAMIANGLTWFSTCREDTSLLQLRTMGCVISLADV